MQVLVVTIVHHPGDARISHRQIPALINAGHHVSLAAPFSAFDAQPADGVTAIDLPRASARSRGAARRAARELLKSCGNDFDLILIHDPELLLAIRGIQTAPVIWDVHEDTAAAVSMKAWIPTFARPLAAGLVTLAERWASSHVHLIFAEASYQARFKKLGVVVPNTTWVPETISESAAERVVYLGAVTQQRGALDLIDMARTLGRQVRVELIGPIHPSVAEQVRQAHDAGELIAHGFVPNDQALGMLNGAIAGVCLLHDEPNYRHSQPTKIIEYMAHGIPVITTPLPVAIDIIDDAQCGLIVPFENPAAAAAAILSLKNDQTRRQELGRAGHDAALRSYDWTSQGPLFVQALERILAHPNA
ncbi:MAG: glycosyltransferase [Actinomycetes bacterium]